MTATALPLPSLEQRFYSGIAFLTDDALASSVGIRAGFTGRAGGVSEGPYASLNLGSHVHDDNDAVKENRRLLLDALGVGDCPLIVPNQVHGDHVVSILSADAGALEDARREAAEGTDALVVGAAHVAALLCFADCTPVIVAAPSGHFAIAHAGWRGAVAGITGKTIKALCDVSGVCACECNVYIGPHIRVECFETGQDVIRLFTQACGPSCIAADGRHVSLAQAVRLDAEAAGADPLRIVDAGVCTQCRADDYFSYRASAGTCGRHGAFAVRPERR